LSPCEGEEVKEEKGVSCYAQLSANIVNLIPPLIEKPLPSIDWGITHKHRDRKEIA
jgi:hypothetical protein